MSRTVVGVATVVMLACVAADVSAYTVHGRWPRGQMPIPWYIHHAGSVDLGIDVSEREVRAAFQTWEDVECAYITFRFGGRTSRRADNADFVNVVSWTESGWPYDPITAAQAEIYTVPGAGDIPTLTEVDINVNGQHHTWTTTGIGGPDLRNIMTHEVGHFLGLHHSTDPNATMHSPVPPGTAGRTLEADDIAGVCFLYPEEDGGCTTDRDCPAGHRCSGGICVPDTGGDGLMCSPCSSSDDCSEGLCITGFVDGGSYCGRNCTSDAECGPGNRCWPVGDGNVPDQCAPANRDCRDQPECRRDEDCPVGQVCRGGRCVPSPDPGEGELGAPCADGSECRTGLCLDGYCTRSCPPHQPLGSCPDGYYCDDLSCGEGRCRRGGPGAGPVGSPCSQDTDCESAYCETAGGLFACRVPCDPLAAVSSCPAGSLCQPGETAACGVCLCGGGLFGDACRDDSDCFLGACRALPGEPFRCTTGCHPEPGAAGSPCPFGADCLTAVEPDGTAVPRCFAAGGTLGAGCRGPEDCRSGICAYKDGIMFCSRACTRDCTCPVDMGCSDGYCNPTHLLGQPGCGCRAAGATPNGAWLSLALVLLTAGVWRRRRQTRWSRSMS